ncbi:hypothetical protein EMIHUDRAFT_224247 [Emiliania huxleyi CCMP1516]|uniref:BTB domain-containing protein n=2 Tax=Emiliania huxleyi TaxID=2903 RepID=A0A0D3KSS6_EMIH1|nr:hypothetical protein EMIHUDRAFT_224247 [Emiliania huxleyi CCMP1516]EOD38811.1 hypothetical protein EMIHUDRAFT_224247 [Emiliania huxleyi CCMP1516]|eukprot:XP_005791240.1 hypothetical protein EMIHUDRAFT_224247 [Emiliania huxleyi CCMP1516]
MAAHRMSARLSGLSPEQLLAFIDEQAPLWSDAAVRVAEEHARLVEQPEWILSEVLLSPDLAPHILAQLPTKEHAVKGTCRAWRRGWKQTLRARTGGGEVDEEPVPVADGFDARIFGARVVGQVSTLTLEGEDGPLSLGPVGVASDHAGAWYVATKDSLLHVSTAGRVRRVAALPASDDYYYTAAASPDGSAVFVADFSGHEIRRVEVATGEVTTIAGSGTRGSTDGVGDAAEFNNPCGIAISSDASALFVADHENHKIRRVETIAGSGASGSTDGVGDAAQFYNPHNVAISPDGGALFGMVTFLVGDDEERVEHVTKANLCARSPVFRTMFGIGMKERDAAEVTVAHTDPASFTALIDYLLSDKFDLGEEAGGRAQRALDLRELAQMYQVPRLELLCAQALQESVAPATAVPLLEAAHTMGDGRLLAQCRCFVADHAAEVRASGGVEQLRDFGVAKGLLGDALDQVAELKGAVAARDAELEKVRADNEELTAALASQF